MVYVFIKDSNAIASDVDNYQKQSIKASESS